MEILSRLASTHVTSCPQSAKHAPETSPTYPVPTMQMRTCGTPCLRISVQDSFARSIRDSAKLLHAAGQRRRDHLLTIRRKHAQRKIADRGAQSLVERHGRTPAQQVLGLADDRPPALWIVLWQWPTDVSCTRAGQLEDH